MCGRVGQLPVHQKALEGINVGIVPYYYALLHMIFFDQKVDMLIKRACRYFCYGKIWWRTNRADGYQDIDDGWFVNPAALLSSAERQRVDAVNMNKRVWG